MHGNGLTIPLLLVHVIKKRTLNHYMQNWTIDNIKEKLGSIKSSSKSLNRKKKQPTANYYKRSQLLVGHSSISISGMYGFFFFIRQSNTRSTRFAKRGKEIKSRTNICKRNNKHFRSNREKLNLVINDHKRGIFNRHISEF